MFRNSKHAVLAAALTLLANSPGYAQNATSETAPQRLGAVEILSSIQQRVASARSAALEKNDASPLGKIADELSALDPGASSQLQFFLPYWQAYTEYQIAYANLVGGRREEVSDPLDRAYRRLSGIQRKDAESYALQSMVAGLKIAVASRDQFGEAMSQARDALEQATKAGPDNIRVLYARASADFSTPREYGGGRRAEQLLRAALALPAEPRRGMRPTWGQEESAAMLIRILRDTNRTSEAKALHATYRQRFPDSSTLSRVAEGL